MINADLKKNQFVLLAQPIVEAAKGNDEEKMTEAFAKFAQQLQERIIQEAESLAGVNDTAVLAQRGVHQLTSAEKKYYQSVIDAMKSAAPQQSLAEIEKVLPKTVIDRVFEDLQEEHPLLNVINFTNTGAIIEWVISNGEKAYSWGDLCDPITAENGAKFEVLPMGLKKVTAWMPVCDAMLDLGPEWLDRYVRTLLSESLATGLEGAIVDGDGDKKPIGMTRKLTGDSGGKYPRKSAVKVTKLDAAGMGEILAILALKTNGKQRPVKELLMVVNPLDYFTKVFPATTPRASDGSFTQNALPFPTTVIQSAFVPAGHAVFGIASEYFCGIGTAKGGKLEYSDHYKFLEEYRTYKIKIYANGRAKNENDFVLADISELKPAIMQVEISETTPIVSP